jgi:hypothetical protein
MRHPCVSPLLAALGNAGSLTKRIGLCHFVNDAADRAPYTGKMAETLDFAKSWRVRLSGADHLRDLAENYSRCRLIKTSEASTTPTPSIPTAIWPSAMLRSVQARVVDPINSGMGGDPEIDRQ